MPLVYLISVLVLRYPATASNGEFRLGRLAQLRDSQPKTTALNAVRFGEVRSDTAYRRLCGSCV